jgi:hypothetical protein
MQKINLGIVFREKRNIFFPPKNRHIIFPPKISQNRQILIITLTPRFCVSVRRHNFPLETSAAGSALESSAWIQPAHTITFVPPIVVVNLLPCCVRVQLKGSETPAETVEPGKESCISVR